MALTDRIGVNSASVAYCEEDTNEFERLADPSSPMGLNYMKKLKFYLNLLGAWPFEDLYDLYKDKPKRFPFRDSKSLIIYWTVVFTSGFLYVKTNIRELNFFELGHNYIIVSMIVVALQRATMPLTKSYKKTIFQFVSSFHLFHHKEKSNYAMKVYKQVHKFSAFFTIALYFQMYVGSFLFNITPFYNNIQSGVFKDKQHIVLDNNTQSTVRYEYSIYHYIPFEVNNIGHGFIVILNYFLTLDGASSFCTYDVLMCIIIFHVWGHLKILKHHLGKIPKPAAEQCAEGNDFINVTMYSKEELKRVFVILKENIEHHKLIMGFMNLTSEAFGMMMCFYYTLHLVIGCILLLEISSLDADAIASYGVLTVIMFQQLIQTSIIFELIGYKSETIKHAVYNIPWECLDVKNRKILLFFLCNVQTPITLKAMGMVSVGVQTMAAILRTSFSYFIMLRTFTENECVYK